MTKLYLLVLINKEKEMKQMHYYLNKYLYFPPYHLWAYLGERFTKIGNGKRYCLHYLILRWIGNNVGFKGISYLERYMHMKKLRTKLGDALNDTFNK
tara:strand:- start:169 stop:459 length:291 start_codon:yes stop_codon:yes gene_type:complete